VIEINQQRRELAMTDMRRDAFEASHERGLAIAPRGCLYRSLQ